MATINKRKKADGSFSYTAQIRIKRGGLLVYSESQTFGKKALAQAWAVKREGELAVPGALERLQHRGVLVGDLVRRYVSEVGGVAGERAWQGCWPREPEFRELSSL